MDLKYIYYIQISASIGLVFLQATGFQLGLVDSHGMIADESARLNMWYT